MFSPLLFFKNIHSVIVSPSFSLYSTLPNPPQLKSLHPKFPFPFSQHHALPYYNPSLHLLPHCPKAPIYFPPDYSSVSHEK